MTENKRFTITQDFEEHHRQIRDNGHIIMGCFIEPQAEVIVDLLNELNDENKELRIQYNHIREQSNEFHRIARENANRVGQLEKENKELKAEMEQSDLISKDIVCADIQHKLLKVTDENKELKEINQDHQDHISLLEEEKINLQIKLQKIRNYAMENGVVKQDVIEKVVFE